MTDYLSVSTTITILPKGEPIFSEMATTVYVDDECGGPFVTIKQEGGSITSISVSAEDWPAIRDAVEEMLRACAVLEGGE